MYLRTRFGVTLQPKVEYRERRGFVNIKTLQYLIELERFGSVYAAARETCISQQGMSKAIASLENELGCSLVTRSPHGTALTDAGKIVLGSARSIVAEHKRMTERLLELDDLDDISHYRINVFVSHYAAQIASIDPEYIRLLSMNTFYVEEPFGKLLMRAEQSDGTDLVFTDIFGQTVGQVADNPKVSFEPIIQTRYGFIWKEGMRLHSKTALHRGEVCDLPVAIDTNPEAGRLIDSLFSKHPLRNVRMGTSSQRMLVEYVQMADSDVLAFSDSFSYYSMKKNGLPEVQGLHFTPLATLKSVAQVGFLLPAKAPLSPQALHTIRTLRRYIAEKCPDYS